MVLFTDSCIIVNRTVFANLTVLLQMKQYLHTFRNLILNVEWILLLFQMLVFSWSETGMDLDSKQWAKVILAYCLLSRSMEPDWQETTTRGPDGDGGMNWTHFWRIGLLSHRKEGLCPAVRQHRQIMKISS